MSSEITNLEYGEMDILPIFGSTHAVNFHHQESRDDINSLFDEITFEARTPNIIYNEIVGILHEAGYDLPTPTTFDQSDELVYALMLHEGDDPEYFYFAHSVVYEDGGSEIHAEVLTEEELQELFDIDE